MAWHRSQSAHCLTSIPALMSAGSRPVRRNASRRNRSAQPAAVSESPETAEGAVEGTGGGRFQLTKWYLDCVSESGEAMIGYWAELRWRKLAVHYASVMMFVDGQLRERSTLRAGQAPQLAGGLLEWSCNALHTSGTWRATARPPISRVLHRHGDRRLEWQCIQPLAEASVRCGEHQISGPGYTECITLTVAPWKLPIEELRWGRAHFPGRSVVWIDWTGPEPTRMVLVDMKEVEGIQVTDALVSTPRTTIKLAGRCVLREGPVAGSSAGAVPGVRQALSRAGLLMDEHKWLSSATLEEGDVTLQGNAIHEVVKWR